MPKRIQRKRTKGWKMPPNTVYIGRPSKWGNPYMVNDFFSKEDVIKLHASYIEHWYDTENLSELRGKDLCCWCKEGEPCHGDILLDLANK